MPIKNHVLSFVTNVKFIKIKGNSDKMVTALTDLE